MIQLDHIEYRHASFRLRIDQLRLSRGITLLVGPNGAGKTTLLKLLATALSPHEGEIRYLNKTTREALPLIRSCIGFLPTGLELYEDMTPYKLLSYMAELKGISSREEIESLLDRFGFQPLRNKKINELSQGQHQRLGIAQAFLGDPLFLLLDEALNYLDIYERKKIINELAKSSERKAILVSTHELNEWEFVADDILWMDEGFVCFHGSPARWKMNLPWSVWSGKIDPNQLHTLNPHRLLSLRMDGQQAFIRIIGPRPPAESFEETTPNLEDAYYIRRLTKGEVY
ncbi:ATP-binding cassette domain-containing protein [Paenibacillus sp. J2TS4]|uniref:ATP-binding cassette domain-containing protein n=1 Tax=Paenibacillus sp. J2TS4 TaxID=2807194 RepID=UPI001B170B53|nr:ABC transporter ATP-binding protein [Paenibacillus sp. J2TS4]GIP35491.1 multidrug ABC transporter ATP-binding protein [Paenibacillus sp. J2TS4]